MIVCAGNQEVFEFAKSVGIGLIDSTIGLTQVCLFDRPEYILFIGSAGSYGEHKIFDIVESRSSANIELGFFNDDCYTPIDNVSKSDNKFVKDTTIVNSSNYITTNEELSKQFKEYAIGIENMEFYALMQVAQKFQIPIGGVFVVTNHTNKNAHEDFLNNHKKAMEKLVDYLEKENIIKEQIKK
jgi:nucleoside phosphorylase